MRKMLQGLMLGWIIVLPGMSGGTVFIILGIYEELLRDIAAFRIKPYWPMLLGTAVGIFLGGTTFALLVTSNRDLAVAFLLGLLLASIRTVLLHRPAFTPGRGAIMLGGFMVGFFMAGEPVGILKAGEGVNLLLLGLGGVLSSAAMFIPGVPGSSILIIMGIYDQILFYVSRLTIYPLISFGIGALAGILLLARILENYYFRYRDPISFFFAGLIGGSARALWPSSWNMAAILLFALGFFIVWQWGGGAGQKKEAI